MSSGSISDDRRKEVMNEYDVIVVGAGPGGAVAARHAAMKGASVLLVDRRKEIGIPVTCGELTSGGTLTEFSLRSDGPWVAKVLDKAKMIFPGEREMDFHGITFVVLNRDVLEQHLVDLAKKEGVVLRTRTCVKGVTGKGVRLKSGEMIRGRIIIAADGVKSSIGKSMGITKAHSGPSLGRAVKCIVESPYVDETACKFYIGEKGMQGYAWIFPKGDKTANVGIGSLGNTKGYLKPVLERFLAEHLPGVRMRDFAAGCLPLALPPERTVWKNVMLVGDAASMVNSVGGAGIRNAMVAGRFAGNIAGKCIKDDLPMSFLEGYEKAWRKKLYHRLKVNVLLKDMMWHSDRSVRCLYPLVAPLNRISNMIPGLITWLQEKQHM